MSAFDELTLGEMDEIRTTCLDGKGVQDPTVDPLTLSGAIMWAHQKQTDPGLSWDAFKQKTKMGDIKAFALKMQADEEADTENP